MSYVNLSSVKKQYGDKSVLNNISFAIKKGEFITLLGQSGCGKSTLLRSIAGIVNIDDGAISVSDKDITNLPSRKREIGMVFQSYALFPNMTVTQNIGFGMKMKRLRNRKQEIEKMIKLIGLDGVENHYPHELSGGQQQRVALARALILKPKILLLDEPLSALDAKIRKSLQTEIKRIQREMNITTIFVTHDQKEAMVLSDRIYVMNKGVIEQAGTPETIYTRPENKFVAGFIGSYNILTNSELKHCVKEEFDINSPDIAIRPESITMYTKNSKPGSHNGSYTSEGKIRMKTISGSVVSYQIQVKTKHIQVDQLFQGENHLNEGDAVDLVIPKQDCIPLE
ncbi:ABC transporter ATP-binding protein [Lentibacillus halophilus]|uniref:ABC transporter ATP-binding protein n=1 Tax=Lentibacillus halophilus TaxID=295065 RepID=A0ABN0ZI95_9BACI